MILHQTIRLLLIRMILVKETDVKVVKNAVSPTAIITCIFGLISLSLILAGLRPFILVSESMEPIYKKGSLCWVNTRTDYSSLNVGDVIVYRSPANTLVLHRIVEIIPEDNSLSVVMQGDANNTKQAIDLSNINLVGRSALTTGQHCTA